eukprot:CAMPEP_0197860084 /NCGR_PEP_ID=MMETSP1438-20131217/35223_1 /TAXON_ID=1461541 /ORGANISM="Pterosperma sp., Strain CCMP1384" /LENGTH=394 /DNA_ID=CAMNT_0043476835 /DNA_START=260 /DNA_END=1444 /DNA_ORIENTATION=-
MDPGTIFNHPVVGRVQDCDGMPPYQQGTLCGVSSGFVWSHYLLVTAEDTNRLTVIDIDRPAMLTVVGSIRSNKLLPAPMSVVVSFEYVVVASRGFRPDRAGMITLIDISPQRWKLDPMMRWVVEPEIVDTIKDCQRSSDPTFPNMYGATCGARALAMRHNTVFVCAEHSNTIAAIDLGVEIGTGQNRIRLPPRLVGSLHDHRLNGVRAIAIKGIVAYVVTNYCETCLVIVDVSSPGGMSIRQNEKVEAADVPFGVIRPLRSIDHIARYATEGWIKVKNPFPQPGMLFEEQDELIQFLKNWNKGDAETEMTGFSGEEGMVNAYMYLMMPKLGEVVAIERECAERAVEIGYALHHCTEDYTYEILERYDYISHKMIPNPNHYRRASAQRESLDWIM